MSTPAADFAPLNVIVLAAGRGTRMKSRHPKVLQRLAGRPLLGHVLHSAAQVGASRMVVVTGHGAQEVQIYLGSNGAFVSSGLMGENVNFNNHLPIQTVLQSPQLGTGHAVAQALPALGTWGDEEISLILCGDVPLTPAATLAELVRTARASDKARLAVLTVELPDPTGYGRIVRDAAGGLVRIVEHKDASEAERRITEVNTGILAAPTAALARWLPQLQNNNAQGEFYLTDIVALARAEGMDVGAHKATSATDVQGINSPAQLADLERAHQRRLADALMDAGVRLTDPTRLDLRDADGGTPADLRCAQDVEIDVGCIFTGRVIIENDVKIGAYCHITNTKIAAGTIIAPFTHIQGDAPPALDNAENHPKDTSVKIGENAKIGPFARLRPGVNLGADVHIGNFVEIKNAQLSTGAKANHLAYIGDAQVGQNVNYGAGSITANYDGANKHQTIIEDNAHIGSNCVLVAPVKIGQNATVGAGSTITKTVEDNHLVFRHAPLETRADWQRPRKK